jgi:ribulose bisphosphate carboxylase small subunit
MLGLRLRVVTSDGELGEFAVTPKVQVEFERHFKIGVGKAFQQEQRVEHMYWLAWKAVHAAGHAVKPFDSWLDDIVDVQMAEDVNVPLDGTA